MQTHLDVVSFCIDRNSHRTFITVLKFNTDKNQVSVIFKYSKEIDHKVFRTAMTSLQVNPISIARPMAWLNVSFPHTLITLEAAFERCVRPE